MAKLTKQEMFNRAYIGLAKQGWKRAVLDIGGDQTCVYQTGDLRCAWGHVDPSLDHNDVGSVRSLHYGKRGLAAGLGPGQLEFARELQIAHDGATNATLRAKMKSLAKQYGLKVPRVR